VQDPDRSVTLGQSFTRRPTRHRSKKALNSAHWIAQVPVRHRRHPARFWNEETPVTMGLRAAVVELELMAEDAGRRRPGHRKP
jgi:hypothetical protein